MQTCTFCGHKTNGHHNSDLTCSGCGKPFGINAKIEVIGTLAEGYEPELSQISCGSMYRYGRYCKDLKLFVSKTNELYRIKNFNHR